jgi:hypothetical protein
MSDNKDDKEIIVPSKGNRYLQPYEITGIGTPSMGGGKVRDNEGTIDGKPRNKNGTLDGKEPESREEREKRAAKTLSLGTKAAEQMKRDPAEVMAEFFGKNFRTSNPYFPKAEKNTIRSVRGDGPQTKLRPSKKKISAFGQMNEKTALGDFGGWLGPFGAKIHVPPTILRGAKYGNAHGIMNFRDWGTGDKQIWGTDFTSKEEDEED